MNNTILTNIKLAIYEYTVLLRCIQYTNVLEANKMEMSNAIEDNKNNNPICLNAIDKFPKEQIENANNDSIAGIPLAVLLKLHDISFKLVPLGDDFKPYIKWMPVYENHDYWTLEKLIEQASIFKNGVATVFGKTRISDEKGCLFLNCLDIDSEEAYNILANLANGERGFSFIAEAMKNTYVTKTRRPNGYHIYWLSHKQHESIFKRDCKAGYEFEIKCGKSGGLSTLPPSPHRGGSGFHYTSYGQEKLVVSDVKYNRLIEILKPCLKENNDDADGNRKGAITYSERQTHDHIIFTENDNEEIIFQIKPYYQKGYRQNVALGLSGLMYKGGVDLESAKKLVVTLCSATFDEESASRLAALSNTYSRGSRGEEISGASLIYDVLTGVAGTEVVNDILNNITRVWNKYKNPILMQLQDHIRQELQPHTVEILCYSPLTFVVAHTHKKQILYAKVENKALEEDEPLQEQVRKKRRKAK